MDLHNLNIRLIENKSILWTTTSANHEDDIHEELCSTRVSSGIVHQCALLLSESLWLKWISSPLAKQNMKVGLHVRKEYTDRGVMGIWLAAHEKDEVAVLSDVNMHSADKLIADMSYAFVHLSQVKYPRQYDAPVRKV